jgi:hypothetical protein
MIVFTKFHVGDIVAVMGHPHRWQVTNPEPFEARVEHPPMSEKWAGSIRLDESKCELWKPE